MKKLLILLLILLNLFITTNITNKVSAVNTADTTIYTSVLEDLEKDKNFNKDNYKKNTSDNSISIITLAESADNKLFVYTFQPNGLKDMYASSINITTDAIFDYSNYKLKFISQEELFFKYEVEDIFILPDLEERTYLVSSIFRNFNSKIDSNNTPTNPISEIAYAVGKSYSFSNYNGNYITNESIVDIINVTEKFCGKVRFYDGFFLSNTDCDAHFIAFDSDKKIDNLFKVKVSYVSNYMKCRESVLGKFYDKKTISSNNKEIWVNYKEKVSYRGQSSFSNSYTWDSILSIDNFITTMADYDAYYTKDNESYKINTESLALLKSKKWVVFYDKTTYLRNPIYYPSSDGTQSLDYFANFYYHNTDITLLQLYFETEGVTYNLGVVDNKVSEQEKPINEQDKIDWLAILLFFLLCVGVLIVYGFCIRYLSNPLSIFIGLIIDFFIWLFKLFKRS